MYISLLGLQCLPSDWCKGINTADSLASDLCGWDRTYTISRDPLWAERTCPPNPLGGFCLTSHPCVGFPLSFCVHTISLSPYCFPPLIHRNPHLRGTEHITRCVLRSTMSCTCSRPGNHNDIAVSAFACMSLVVSPMAWMNDYSFTFQWINI